MPSRNLQLIMYDNMHRFVTFFDLAWRTQCNEDLVMDCGPCRDMQNKVLVHGGSALEQTL